MSIVKIDAGLASSPSVFAQPVLNQIAALLNSYNKSAIIKDGYILKGSLFCIGGSMYTSNSDTAISGTVSPYVAITASGSSASASYTENINSAEWDGSFHNYYDNAGVLYLFDESDAINDGFIATRYYAPTPTGEPNHFILGNNIVENFLSSLVSRAIPDAGTNSTGFAEIDNFISPRAGKIRVSACGFKSGGAHGYLRIYVDGAAVGSLHSTNYEVFSEDIVVNKNSLVSLYGMISDTNYNMYGRILNYKSGIIV